MSESKGSQSGSVLLKDLSDEQQASVIANHHYAFAMRATEVERCVEALNKALAEAATAGLRVSSFEIEEFEPERHFVGTKTRHRLKVGGLHWTVT